MRAGESTKRRKSFMKGACEYEKEYWERSIRLRLEVIIIWHLCMRTRESTKRRKNYMKRACA